MRNKIVTMVILCCFLAGMTADSVAYGAERVKNDVEGAFFEEGLEEKIEELGELDSVFESDNGFTYKIISNVSTGNEEVEIVGYFFGEETELVIPSEIDGRVVSSLYSLQGTGSYTHNYTIESIKIPASVNKIYESAFGAYDALAQIQVSDENNYYCTDDGILYTKDKLKLCVCPRRKIGTVTILENVTHIGQFAFSGCASINRIIIPASVIQIEGEFSGCENLINIEVDEENANYCSEDGILYNKLKTELYACMGSKEGIVEIPSSVTKISDSAFSVCKYITEVKMSAGVTEIGDLAFYQCKKLASVTIPDTVKRIGMGAFSWTPCLTKITIPASVTEIGVKAFDSCTALTEATILSMKIDIAPNAFMNSQYYPFIIYCRPGSDAEVFAKENGFKYDYNTGYDFPDEPNNEGQFPSDIPSDGTGQPLEPPVSGETPSDTSGNTIETLTLNKSAIYFDAIGETENLTALVTPQSQNVTWTSNNSSVATVQNGTVTATGNGTAVITATAGNQSASLTVTVSQRTNKISLTLNSQSVSGTLKVRVRKSYNFKAKVEPANADSKNKKVEWKSSNTKIATIKNGKVTIKKSGTVTITAKTGDGKTAKIKLKSSKNPVKVTRIKISGNKSMGAKSKQNLKLLITPATADNSKVIWSSSDKKIATVDKNGKVAAKKKGTVTITAKAKDGSGKKGAIKIKVK